MTEPVEDAVEDSGDEAKNKRLTPREYARAKTMWQSGEYSLAEISEQVGVTATALSRRFKRDSIARGSDAKKVSAAVKRAIEKTSAAQAEELASAAHDMKMLALKSVELFNKKAYSDVAKAIRDGKPLGDMLNDLKALEVASKVVAQNYGTGARILGLDQSINPDEVMPELQIHLMTENDVAELRAQQRREEAEEDLDDLDMPPLTSDELDELDKVLDEAEEKS